MSDRSWKTLTACFFLLVFVEGALRKWILPGYQAELYVVKDVVLIMALAFVASGRRLTLPQPLRGTAFSFLVATYAVIATLQAFNPRLPAIAVGLLGLKSHVLYVGLIFLVRVVLPESARGRERLLRTYVLAIALPIMALGAYQFFQPPGHWINQYVRESADVATAGLAGRARVTGTFSYISGMTVFLLFNLSIGLGLILGGFRRRRGVFWAGILLAGLSLVVGPMNGSRSFLVLPALGLVLLLPILLAKPLYRRAASAGAALLVCGMLALDGTSAVEGWQTLRERVAGSDDARARIEDTAFGPVRRMLEAGPLGYGAGATHQAAARLVSPDAAPWLPPLSLEEENGRVAVELGWIGLVAFLLLKVSCVALALRVFAAAGTWFEAAMGASAVVFLTAHLVAPVVFNSTAGALYWGCVGVVVHVFCMQRAGGIGHTGDASVVDAPCLAFSPAGHEPPRN